MHFRHVIYHTHHSYSVICYMWYWLLFPVLLYGDQRNVYFVSHVCSIVIVVSAAGSKDGYWKSVCVVISALQSVVSTDGDVIGSAWSVWHS